MCFDILNHDMIFFKIDNGFVKKKSFQILRKKPDLIDMINQLMI